MIGHCDLPVVQREDSKNKKNEKEFCHIVHDTADTVSINSHSDLD